jgi:hypothetical protein
MCTEGRRPRLGASWHIVVVCAFSGKEEIMRATVCIAAGLVLSCSPGTGAVGDDDCGSCRPGSVCVDGVCVTICRVAADCDDPCSPSNPTGESCIDDVCVSGVGCGLEPVIAAIDGIGEVNAAGDQHTAEHFVGSGLRISGSGLRGASVVLESAGSSDLELAVDESSDTELVACLPEGTAAGVYTVTVTNQSGSTCGNFQLVQGSYTGEQVVQLVNDGLSENSSLSLVGTLTQTEADNRYVNTSGDLISGELDVYGPLAVGHTSPEADLLVRGLLTDPVAGTVTVTAGNQEVLGTDTQFDSELRAGDALLIGGNVYQVESITDDTHLTLTESAVANATGVSASRDRNLARVQTGKGATVLNVDRSGTVEVWRALDIGLERVSDSCTGITCVATASCPAGKRVLSGGCQFTNCPQHGYDYSYPAGDLTGWVCRSNQCSDNTAYAVCGRVQ